MSLLSYSAPIITIALLFMIIREHYSSRGGPWAFGRYTGAEEVVATVGPFYSARQSLPLRHIEVLVTGGTSGIGEETAFVLALHGAHVWLHGRTLESAQAAIDRCKERSGRHAFDSPIHVAKELAILKSTWKQMCAPLAVGSKERYTSACRRLDERIAALTESPSSVLRVIGVDGGLHMTPLAADLSSLDEVHDMATDLIRQRRHLHAIILNAGIMALPTPTYTPAGVELQMATNYLSHYLLTSLLLPKLEWTAAHDNCTARVIVVASAAHRYGNLSFLEDPLLRPPGGDDAYTPWLAYGNSNAARMLFAREFSARYATSKRVAAYSLHPGVIMTELGRHIPLSRKLAMLPILATRGKSVDAGAATSVYLTVAGDEELVPGEYYEDAHLSEAGDNLAAGWDNAELRSALWDRSARLTMAEWDYVSLDGAEGATEAWEQQQQQQ